MPPLDLFEMMLGAVDVVEGIGHVVNRRPREQSSNAGYRRSGPYSHPELGRLTPRSFGRRWLASVEVVEPPAQAVVKLRGDENGPNKESLRRATDLVSRWSELAAGPVARALAERGLVLGGDPYRGTPAMGDFYRRHPISTLILDARRAKCRIALRFHGLAARVAIRGIKLDPIE